jgi:hypothetical protein
VCHQLTPVALRIGEEGVVRVEAFGKHAHVREPTQTL